MMATRRTAASRCGPAQEASEDQGMKETARAEPDIFWRNWRRECIVTLSYFLFRGFWLSFFGLYGVSAGQVQTEHKRPIARRQDDNLYCPIEPQKPAELVHPDHGIQQR